MLNLLYKEVQIFVVQNLEDVKTDTNSFSDSIGDTTIRFNTYYE